jgi:hypothetical protein
VPLGSIFRVKYFDRRDRSNKSKAKGGAVQPKTPAGYHLILCLKCKGEQQRPCLHPQRRLTRSARLASSAVF